MSQESLEGGPTSGNTSEPTSGNTSEPTSGPNPTGEPQIESSNSHLTPAHSIVKNVIVIVGTGDPKKFFDTVKDIDDTTFYIEESLKDHKALSNKTTIVYKVIDFVFLETLENDFVRDVWVTSTIDDKLMANLAILIDNVGYDFPCKIIKNDGIDNVAIQKNSMFYILQVGHRVFHAFTVFQDSLKIIMSSKNLPEIKYTVEKLTFTFDVLTQYMSQVKDEKIRTYYNTKYVSSLNKILTIAKIKGLYATNTQFQGPDMDWNVILNDVKSAIAKQYLPFMKGKDNTNEAVFNEILPLYACCLNNLWSGMVSVNDGIVVATSNELESLNRFDKTAFVSYVKDFITMHSEKCKNIRPYQDKLTIPNVFHSVFQARLSESSYINDVLKVDMGVSVLLEQCNKMNLPIDSIKTILAPNNAGLSKLMGKLKIGKNEDEKIIDSWKTLSNNIDCILGYNGVSTQKAFHRKDLSLRKLFIAFWVFLQYTCYPVQFIIDIGTRLASFHTLMEKTDQDKSTINLKKQKPPARVIQMTIPKLAGSDAFTSGREKAMKVCLDIYEERNKSLYEPIVDYVIGHVNECITTFKEKTKDGLLNNYPMFGEIINKLNSYSPSGIFDNIINNYDGKLEFITYLNENILLVEFLSTLPTFTQQVYKNVNVDDKNYADIYNHVKEELNGYIDYYFGYQTMSPRARDCMFQRLLLEFIKNSCGGIVKSDIEFNVVDCFKSVEHNIDCLMNYFKVDIDNDIHLSSKLPSLAIKKKGGKSDIHPNILVPTYTVKYGVVETFKDNYSLLRKACEDFKNYNVEIVFPPKVLYYLQTFFGEIFKETPLLLSKADLNIKKLEKKVDGYALIKRPIGGDAEEKYGKISIVDMNPTSTKQVFSEKEYFPLYCVQTIDKSIVEQVMQSKESKKATSTYYDLASHLKSFSNKLDLYIESIGFPSKNDHIFQTMFLPRLYWYVTMLYVGDIKGDAKEASKRQDIMNVWNGDVLDQLYLLKQDYVFDVFNNQFTELWSKNAQAKELLDALIAFETSYIFQDEKLADHQNNFAEALKKHFKLYAEKHILDVKNISVEDVSSIISATSFEELSKLSFFNSGEAKSGDGQSGRVVQSGGRLTDMPSSPEKPNGETPGSKRELKGDTSSPPEGSKEETPTPPEGSKEERQSPTGEPSKKTSTPPVEPPKEPPSPPEGSKEETPAPPEGSKEERQSPTGEPPKETKPDSPIVQTVNQLKNALNNPNSIQQQIHFDGQKQVHNDEPKDMPKDDPNKSVMSTTTEAPSGQPSGQPSGPSTGPPSGPTGPLPGPPSGPTGAPSGQPSGPSNGQLSGPPSGPASAPSRGPPSGPPSGQQNGPPSATQGRLPNGSPPPPSSSIGISREISSIENKRNMKSIKMDFDLDRVKYYVDIVNSFKKQLESSKTTWIYDLSTAIDALKSQVNDILDIYNKNSTAMSKEVVAKRLMKLYSKMVSIKDRQVQLCLTRNKSFFLKEARKKIKYLERVNKIVSYYEDFYAKNPEAKKQNSETVAKGGEVATQQQVEEKEIKSHFEYITEARNQIQTMNKYIVEILKINDDFFENILKVHMKMNGTKEDVATPPPQKKEEKKEVKAEAQKGGATEDMLDEDDRAIIETKKERLEQHIQAARIKIKSFYRLKFSIMDIILDSQFFVLYVIKGLRILFTYIALFIAAKIFVPIYEDKVYDQKQNPPSLAQFLFIFLGFDLSFNIFIVVLLFLLKFLFKNKNNNFLIDSYLFNKYLIDYVISMVLLLVIGGLLAKVVTDKKYFKYKYEGTRAIRAYETMMFYVACIIYVFPFFLVF